jgi:CDP-6-deoxy-D-xylo-4-hexulose-3-dehydrase
MSTIEGGLITTNDEEVYHTLLQLRSHGWDRDLPTIKQNELRKKYKVSDFSALYTFYIPGFNFRSTDLQAVIGINQLAKIDMMVESRYQNFIQYKNILESNCWFPKTFDNSYTSSFAIPHISKDIKSKEILINNLNKSGIACRPLISGSMGIQPFYVEKYGELKLPNCSIVDELGIYVPNHDKLTYDEINKVCQIILES